MKSIEIRADLDQASKKLLYGFFKNSNRIIWHKSHVYYSSSGEVIKFNQTIAKRKRSHGKADNRFEVFDHGSDKDLIGKGAYGAVYKIQYVLKLDKERKQIYIVEYNEVKSRVAKLQNHNQVSNPIKNLKKEYKNSLYITHLAIKKPVIIPESNSSVLIMRKIKGKPLTDFIDNDLNNLDDKEKLNISLLTLLALKQQVTDKNLIHMDINPDNIIINYKKPNIDIRFIDLAMSEKIDDLSNSLGGTPAFTAPEVINIYPKNTISTKADVFSIARTIALLWGVEDYKLLSNLQHPFLYYRNASLKASVELSLDNKYKNIEIILKKMLSGHKQRLSVEEALKEFLLIKFANDENKVRVFMALNCLINSTQQLRAKAINLTKRGYRPIGKKLKKAAEAIDHKISHFNSCITNNNFNDLTAEFINDCRNEINTLKIDRTINTRRDNIKFYLGQIALILATAFMYLAALAAKRIITGKGFFTKTNTRETIDKVHKDTENANGMINNELKA